MNSQLVPRGQCPECNNEIEATQMEYGFCGVCRDFFPAQEDFTPERYTPPQIKGGGWMRCCGASLRGWAVYHPVDTWSVGQSVRCVYQLGDDTHVMRLCPCGYWHWTRAMCDERPAP
ncbi:hypothetical protein [Actinacidiphila sp. ITFR-21]|uniref:hypothetical protein n=1 Tax=Actinacidiphila sp. ITFR-21 TaxID=3075199 RepID=UPI00288C2242|nr:hypothetical protein [Streptomyces sp. ITFR-21]WNI17657.1 hypothetical protein RLT57_20420 [Streptomyces sp. ITFR-21]WNI17797.1 hypothetical protein RLT57_21135 [Streptomyces sp. ITFR-21]